MNFKPVIIILIVGSIFTSCASSYNFINPPRINYVSTNTNDDIQLEYKYDLLHAKYAKKESKNNFKLVAVRITNNSDQDLLFGRDIQITHENGTAVNILENEQAYNILKQRPASYLLYLLLLPMNVTVSDAQNSTQTSYPVGLFIGPAIALGNFVGASVANRNFSSEMALYNINGSPIKKGQTKHGLIAIRSSDFEPLKIKLIK